MLVFFWVFFQSHESTFKSNLDVKVLVFQSRRCRTTLLTVAEFARRS